jgi:hypothetical protein
LGKPCRHGHTNEDGKTERYTITDTCVICSRIRDFKRRGKTLDYPKVPLPKPRKGRKKKQSQWLEVPPIVSSVDHQAKTDYYDKRIEQAKAIAYKVKD